jgi:hypothetical protein
LQATLSPLITQALEISLVVRDSGLTEKQRTLVPWTTDRYLEINPQLGNAMSGRSPMGEILTKRRQFGDNRPSHFT